MKSNNSQQQINNETFCLMPWIHFHMDTTGKVKACCTTSITYGELSANSDQKSLEEIWNSKSVKAFRRKLLAGKSDKRCGGCYEREAANKSSMRTETLDKYPELESEIFKSTIEDGTTTMKPYYLDLRFSNVCNLRCRTCWHGASSSWFEEAKLLKNQVGDQAIIKATTNNYKVLKSIMHFSSDLVELYFAGGEPLLMEEHYKLLIDLIARKKSEVILRYNTNLSILKFKDYDICELWHSFKNVRLSVSVDALFDKGSYIRKGLTWNHLIQNFKQIQEKCPHIQFEIAPTISILNVFEIGKLHQYFVEKGLITIDSFYLNLLHRPRNYNIQILPDKLKEQLKVEILKNIDWLLNNYASKNIINEYLSIIEYLNQTSDSSEIELFHDFNSKLDQMRGEDLAQFMPQLLNDIIED